MPPEQNTPPAGNQSPANPPAGTPAPATPQNQPVDVNAAIAKAIAEKEAANSAAFKEATGFDSLQAFTEHKLKSEGKLQELADAKSTEAAQFKNLFQQTAVKAEILANAGDALDSEIVHSLLSHKAVVDEKGAVTIDGKPAKEAIAQLLKDKPFLAKPSGNQGSGAPHNGGSGKQVSRAEFEKMTAASRGAFLKANGTVTD